MGIRWQIPFSELNFSQFLNQNVKTLGRRLYSPSGVRFFKKIQDWILKSERIRKWILRFFTKQINPRSFGSYGASKEPKNPLPEWILRFLWRTMIRAVSWINPSSKETQNPFSDSFGFKNPIEGCSYASSRWTNVFNLPYICLYIFSREPRVGVCLPRQIYRQMYRKSEKLTGSLLAKLHPSNLVNAIFNLVF